ncbi:hypothetical protein ABIB35_000191 [Arthrobacter sp. UYP6]|uniref:hypothetical protein n=1 Tax=Arthrobacter sp. UYP6 TaxID=1756378 RepID=UPI003394E77B
MKDEDMREPSPEYPAAQEWIDSEPTDRDAEAGQRMTRRSRRGTEGRIGSEPDRWDAVTTGRSAVVSAAMSAPVPPSQPPAAFAENSWEAITTTTTSRAGDDCTAAATAVDDAALLEAAETREAPDW